MKNFIFFVIALVASLTFSYAQPTYQLIPGTISLRLDGSDDPAIADFGGNSLDRTKYILGTYYGSDNGGARTNWNSSQFLDFAFFRNPNTSDPNFELFDPPGSGTLGNKQWQWQMNIRMAYPSGWDGVDQSVKYPLIVMMHGRGERGDCWGSRCYHNGDYKNLYNNDHNLLHGGRQHRDAINNGNWPGFVVFPQNKDGYTAGTSQYVAKVAELIEALPDWYPIDKNRVYVHGLSNGGNATWMLMLGRPDLVAAAAPMSGYATNTFFGGTDYVGFDTTVAHIPIWQFQGGRDGAPTPAATTSVINRLTQDGGTPRYYIYENLGHGTWNTAYAEPDFFSWFLQYSKLTIHSFYGVTSVCEGDPIAVKLGVSYGFEDYEWRHTLDGVTTTVPGRTAKWQNEIIATQFGEYEVRIMRDGVWSDWSDPFELSSRPRPSSSIVAETSTVLPALDGRDTVVIKSPETSFQYYKWYKDGILFAEDSTLSELVVDQAGVYTLIPTDVGLCDAFESNPITVALDPSSTNGPFAPTNVSAVAESSSVITVFWTDNSGDETGFEIYRSTSSGGPYDFIGLAPANALLFKDTGLNPNTVYYYRMRSINNNGGSPYSPEVSDNTTSDDVAPTPPQNLVAVDSSFFSATLTWDDATDSEGQIDYYMVITGNDTTIVDYPLNGANAVVNGLFGNSFNPFRVYAVDLAGNVSAPSNQVIVSTFFEGLAYEHSAANLDLLPNFDEFPPEFTGWSAKIDLDQRTQDDFISFKFDGFIYVPADGTYTFYLTSDDGSAMFINPDSNEDAYSPVIADRFIDNDGLHGNRTRTNSIYLTKGGHPISVIFFEKTGGETLRLEYSGPGISRVEVPASAYRSGAATQFPSPNAPINEAAVADPSDFGVNLSWDYDPNTDMKVVVLGSSTAFGTGASVADSAWVNRFDDWLSTRSSNAQVINRALGSYTSYHIRPTGSNNGSNPAVVTDRNITYAMAQNPDIIIVNLPSNNVANDILIDTTMAHYDEIRNVAESSGVKIFFTTTQPRNLSAAKRDSLEAEAQAVRELIGNYTIDIHAELTDFNNSKLIKAQYNSGDGVHVNDDGHAYIFSEVVNTVGPHLLKTDVYRSETSGGPYEIVGSTDYGQTTFADIGLLDSKTYYYVLQAVNASGASDFSGQVSATTIPDTEAPSIPQNIVVQSRSSNSVALSWDASTDNVGVTEYVIYNNGTDVVGNYSGARTLETLELLGTSPSPGTTITGLQPDTNYSFTITAKDNAGMESPQSNPVAVTTIGSLPVEFLDFSATVKSYGVELNWSTASEINNAYFTIERSADLENFEEIGRMDGAGNSNQILEYSFTDTNPMPVTYYRIKQTDIDGAFDYSKVVFVQFNAETEVRVYPNPTYANNINIKGHIGQPGEFVGVQLIDSFGREYYLNYFNQSDIIKGIKVNTASNLNKGLYLIVVRSGSKVITKKLLIN